MTSARRDACVGCTYFSNNECHKSPPVRLPRKFDTQATNAARIRDEALIWGWPKVSNNDWCGEFKPLDSKIQEFIEFVKHAPVKSGICCCGMPMDDTHPEPMDSGHMPTDQWDYQLSEWLKELNNTPETGDGFD